MFRASMAFCLALATCGYSVAEDKEFVYSQKTGVLTLDGKEYAKGYSGKAEGKNNPDKEKEKNVGPIPTGLWKIGKAREFEGMENCFDLAPDGHDAHKRTEFLIHGDSKENPGMASKGCIILDKVVRKKIAESGITKLKVVKE